MARDTTNEMFIRARLTPLEQRKLRALSKKTDVPIARLVGRAVRELLEREREERAA